MFSGPKYKIILEIDGISGIIVDDGTEILYNNDDQSIFTYVLGGVEILLENIANDFTFELQQVFRLRSVTIMAERTKLQTFHSDVIGIANESKEILVPETGNTYKLAPGAVYYALYPPDAEQLTKKLCEYNHSMILNYKYDVTTGDDSKLYFVSFLSGGVSGYENGKFMMLHDKEQPLHVRTFSKRREDFTWEVAIPNYQTYNDMIVYERSTLIDSYARPIYSIIDCYFGNDDFRIESILTAQPGNAIEYYNDVEAMYDYYWYDIYIPNSLGIMSRHIGSLSVGRVYTPQISIWGNSYLPEFPIIDRNNPEFHTIPETTNYINSKIIAVVGLPIHVIIPNWKNLYNTSTNEFLFYSQNVKFFNFFKNDEKIEEFKSANGLTDSQYNTFISNINTYPDLRHDGKYTDNTTMFLWASINFDVPIEFDSITVNMPDGSQKTLTQVDNMKDMVDTLDSMVVESREYYYNTVITHAFFNLYFYPQGLYNVDEGFNYETTLSNGLIDKNRKKYKFPIEKYLLTEKKDNRYYNPATNSWDLDKYMSPYENYIYEDTDSLEEFPHLKVKLDYFHDDANITLNWIDKATRTNTLFRNQYYFKKQIPKLTTEIYENDQPTFIRRSVYHNLHRDFSLIRSVASAPLVDNRGNLSFEFCGSHFSKDWDSNIGMYEIVLGEKDFKSLLSKKNTLKLNKKVISDDLRIFHKDLTFQNKNIASYYINNFSKQIKCDMSIFSEKAMSAIEYLLLQNPKKIKPLTQSQKNNLKLATLSSNILTLKVRINTCIVINVNIDINSSFVDEIQKLLILYINDQFDLLKNEYFDYNGEIFDNMSDNNINSIDINDVLDNIEGNIENIEYITSGGLLDDILSGNLDIDGNVENQILNLDKLNIDNSDINENIDFATLQEMLGNIDSTDVQNGIVTKTNTYDTFLSDNLSLMHYFIVKIINILENIHLVPIDFIHFMKPKRNIRFDNYIFAFGPFGTIKYSEINNIFLQQLPESTGFPLNTSDKNGNVIEDISISEIENLNISFNDLSTEDGNYFTLDSIIEQMKQTVQANGGISSADLTRYYFNVYGYTSRFSFFQETTYTLYFQMLFSKNSIGSNNDTIAPEIDLLGANPLTIEFGSDYIEPGYETLDNSGSVSVSVDTSVLDTNVIGSYTIIYTATDPSENETIVSRIVNVVDSTSPTITIVGNNPYVHEVNTPYNDPGALAADNSGEVITTSTDTSALNTQIVGTYTVTYTATDSSGNTSTSTRTVNIVDSTAPVITLNNNNTLSFEVNTNYIEYGATAQDAYDNSLQVTIQSNVNMSLLGTYSVIYTATDSSGNTSSETRTVNVVDTTPPVITLLGSSEQTIPYSVTEIYTEPGYSAYDSYDGDLTSSVSVSGTVNKSSINTYTLTYSVSDNSGNSTAVQRIVHVVDQVAPIINLNGNSVITLEVGSSYVEYGATATDNIDVNLNIAIDSTAVNTLLVNNAGYNVIYTAVDSSGNATSITRKVKVVDSTAPNVSLIGNSTINVQASQTSQYTDQGVTATDNYDDPIESIEVVNNVNLAMLGTYTVTYTVTDSSGNSSSVTRIVNVVDTLMPNIQILGDNPLQSEVNLPFNDPGVLATDNSGSVNVITDHNVNTSILGTYIVTYTATDSSNNTSIATRNVNVVDTTPPVISLIGDSVINLTVGTPFTDPGATAYDNYDGDLTSDVEKIGTVDTSIESSQQTIKYTVEDSSGNKSEVTRYVNIDKMKGLVIKNGLVVVKNGSLIIN